MIQINKYYKFYNFKLYFIKNFIYFVILYIKKANY